ncbi:hypothetical protein DM860_009302 [Cuscuta australis]|uniref:Protein kinase domain-containing protein n=1 Tax=Cuscuta australis TaxID=267555 RepID=A0A328DAQ1_9ASTE|nr:hypothetical protein DM860_009302 [Cuscuta australis]
MEGEEEGYFVRSEDGYTPKEIIRTTAAAVLWKAAAKPSTPPSSQPEKPVQILMVDADKLECVYELTEEYKLAKRCRHEHLVGVHVSFRSKADNRLWIVMPSVSRVSLRAMITSSPSALPEAGVGTLLRQTLEGLDCVHALGDRPHGNVCAGCVYMADGDFATAKLGFRELMCERTTKRAAECWVAPELARDPKMVHGKAEDVWTFGLFALELVYGGKIPVSTHENVKAPLRDNFNVKAPSSSSSSSRRPSFSWKLFGRLKTKAKTKTKTVAISDLLGEVIRMCLREDPSKRPTTKQLLEHEYFKTTLSSSNNGEESVLDDKNNKMNKALADLLKKACTL